MTCGFKLIRSSITEYYTASNGDHVSITISPDDCATLIICTPVNNQVAFTQKYNSRRGALIAMHKICGQCTFNSMTQTYKPEPN